MDSSENIYSNLVANNKSILIAPAGYGKTYTIAECLKHTTGHQLILTHTHAGVASLKEKIKKNSSNCQCTVETISSFAQKYVEAFYCKSDIPSQDDNKAYFPFIIAEASTLFNCKPIIDVIKSTYSGLFVDEYQDCTISQHQLISVLSQSLPLRILGDPLQGIFGFNGEQLVDFSTDFKDYNRLSLSVPWRWKNTNPQLGENLHAIRLKLLDNHPINLSEYKAISYHAINENDIYIPRTFYYETISGLLKDETSILLIYPDSANKNARIKLVKAFSNRIQLVEAIDSKEFYDFSRKIDTCTTENIFNLLYEICINVFYKSGVTRWFSISGINNKRNPVEKKTIEPVKEAIEKFIKTHSFSLFAAILKSINNLPEVKCYRKELLNDLCKALISAEHNKVSVFDSMSEIRNIKRRIGRKIIGKCIGTTLLTKGLEFDTVVLINAHKFPDSKNLYVALSRASKKLIVFSNTNMLNINAQ